MFQPSPKRRGVKAVLAKLPRGHLAAAHVGGKDVVVARTKSGRIVILPDSCPHQGALLSEGYVDGEHIVCPKHLWPIDGTGSICASSVCNKKRQHEQLTLLPDHSPN